MGSCINSEKISRFIGRNGQYFLTSAVRRALVTAGCTCLFLSFGSYSFGEQVSSDEKYELDLDRSVHETMEEEKKALLRPKSEQTLEGKVTENKSEIMPDRDENVPCFSLHVKNAPVQEVLQNLAELTHKNIIFSGALSGVITADLDNITPEDALDVVLASTGLVARKERASIIIFNGDSVSDKGQSVKSYRLSYADAEEVAKGLNDLSKEGQVSYNRAANTIIIKGTPLEILQTESVLKGLDIPEKQVKVEAQVIAVNRSYAKELGIDWDFRSLTGSADYRRESWNEQQYVTDENGQIRYDKNGNPRMKNIEHNGWNVKIPEGYAGISYGRSIAGHPHTLFFRGNLNALISQGKARILAKPNVVTINGREAEILIGNKIPVLVEHLDNGVRTTTTEYHDAGIKLSYTPRISKNNEITANITAEVSTPYLVPEMRAYRIITRQANTMVRLKSGDMLTIGGLIDREESKTFRKVPILGDLPLLGKLFQSKSKSTEESEIVIIIRADIIE